MEKEKNNDKNININININTNSKEKEDEDEELISDEKIFVKKENNNELYQDINPLLNEISDFLKK